jgi:tetratricopeptide (TPR) repeat protein
MERRSPVKPRKWSAAADRAREELLRPCPYLGYNHDRIGVHCLARDALAIAEKSFRRAIWLNPYEPRFVLHLAHAQFRRKRYEEALETLDELNSKWADFKQGEELRATILAVLRGSTERKY